MLNSGRGEESSLNLSLHVLCYVQGENTCRSKSRCGMAVDIHCGAERPVETGV